MTLNLFSKQERQILRGPQKHKSKEKEREGNESYEAGASGVIICETSSPQDGSTQHLGDAPPRGGLGAGNHVQHT